MNYKILFSFILLYFTFINIVNSLELGISPGNLNFTEKVNEKICQSISIQTNYNGNILGETKWIKNLEKKRDIRDYELNPEDLGLVVDYSNKIKSNGISLKEELCISASKPGKYYGAITYKTEEGYAGVGSWIYVDINGEEQESSLMKITGMSILKKDIINSKNNIFKTITISVFVMLVIILSILLILKKKLSSTRIPKLD